MILLKAGELFHKRGYSAVFIEDVIDASGLAKSTFHQNYSAKASWIGLVGAFNKVDRTCEPGIFRLSR
ncbi:MAG: TetR family transcriptional regulator [Lentimonas sp.]